MKKHVPFTKKQIENIVKTYPTPFHLYDEKGIRDTAKKFRESFSWVEGGFKNYFAVKATPNPFILQILKEEGMGADCSSLPELVLAEKVGFLQKEIMFTSNNTPLVDFQKALALGAVVNFDDISHIPFLERHAHLPSVVSCRYNPGQLRKHKGNTIIGNPEDAKYGMTREQVFRSYKMLRDKGVQKFGLHTMIASNELQEDAFIETAEILFDLVVELSEKLSLRFEFVNLGGGIGIPYQPDQKEVDLAYISRKMKELYQQKIVSNGLNPLQIVMECGRAITGPHGYLVSTVIHKKDTYKKYVGLDASMADLMRPGMYGAYHHITVLGKETNSFNNVYDVTGSLCENNDKFAIDRKLPEIEIGDVVVIHDTGAHGHAMGFNYNGKLRPAEILLRIDNDIQRIRRAETIEDYFATLDFTSLGEENYDRTD